MRDPFTRVASLSRSRSVAAAAVVAGAVTTTMVLAPSTSSAGDFSTRGAMVASKHRVIQDGLDNPRQLSLKRNGALVIAEAGHGSYNKKNCTGSGQEAQCIGLSGKVSVRYQGKLRRVMTHLASAAGADGSFAVGADGASKKPGGNYQAIIAYAPPEAFLGGLPGRRQAGKLLARNGDRNRIVADLARFERNHDPDGEGFDSNPYSVLALRHQSLVADAAGDYIASVRRGHVRLWATLPEYGKRVDAVPTVVSLGGDGNVYVGELHSEIPKEARVWKYDRQGKALRSWGGFTTVTGVARTKGGTLYVSELFGGRCGFDQIPDCFPGRVVKVAPNGQRSTMSVPFPAGIAARGDRVVVSAFSTSPATGFGGNPDWSGQIWRLNF